MLIFVEKCIVKYLQQLHQPKNFRLEWVNNLMVLKGVMDKKPKKTDIEKYAILSQP